jgi:hypothetical protein
MNRPDVFDCLSIAMHNIFTGGYSYLLLSKAHIIILYSFLLFKLFTFKTASSVLH